MDNMMVTARLARTFDASHDPRDLTTVDKSDIIYSVSRTGAVLVDSTLLSVSGRGSSTMTVT